MANITGKDYSLKTVKEMVIINLTLKRPMLKLGLKVLKLADLCKREWMQLNKNLGLI